MMALAVSDYKGFARKRPMTLCQSPAPRLRWPPKESGYLEGEPAGTEEPRPSSGVGRHEVVQGGRVSNPRRHTLSKKVRAGLPEQGDFFVSRQKVSALKGYFPSDFRSAVVFVVMALPA